MINYKNYIWYYNYFLKNFVIFDGNLGIFFISSEFIVIIIFISFKL